jgi:ribosome-associated heat shock protein Hsp15
MAVRLDSLLWRLRLSKTRSLAQKTIAKGHIRINRQRVTKRHHIVRTGDVLTIAMGSNVRTLELLTLPERRGPASESQSHYHVIAEYSPRTVSGTLKPERPLIA